MGCGVSKSQSVEDSSVTSKDKNQRNNLQKSRRKFKSSLVNHKGSESSPSSDINNNQLKSSSTVHFDSSIDQQYNHHNVTNHSTSFPPPPTPHPKVKLLPRQLSRIDEINSESSSLPSTSDAPTVNSSSLIKFDSIACQTEFTAISVMTQTDPLPTPEEELEMLINCEYDFPNNFRPSVDSGQGSSMSNGFSPSSSTIVTNGQVTINTEGSLMVIPANKSNCVDFFQDFEISKQLVTPESRLVDVAIQVAQVRTSCSTQTNIVAGQCPVRPEGDQTQSTTFVNPLKDEDINSNDGDNRLFHRLSTINPQIDNHRPSMTSPTVTWSQIYNNQVNPSDNNQLIAVKVADFESQTDPVSEVMAANAGDNDTNVLQSFNLSSPFSHIEKQLGSIGESSSDTINKSHMITNNLINNKHQNNDTKLQECLNQLLDDIEGSLNFTNTIKKGEYKDASVQTVNDPITDEAPEFAARPPPSRKKEMIPTLTIFESIDAKALEVPDSESSSLISLVNYLISGLPNDMFKVRGIFRWIAHNIRYNWNFMGVSSSSEEILKSREGVCKDYCQLFGDMCLLAGIRVKKIQGFAKGYDYRPGHQFVPGEDITHNWNAVFILGSWRFIDLTWGTGYTDHSGKFQRKLNEHFFLTDPETMIWTHYPYNELEDNYSRWQLLDKPLTLNEFNTLPKVTPYFFEYNLKIRSKLANPISFRVQTEIKIGGHEAMRYKYKLYPADEVENASLNHYLFCQLKEDRMVGSFQVTPPIEGRYFLKIYARPEKDMAEWNIDATTNLPPPATTSSLTSGQQGAQSNLHSCVTFLLECSRSRKYLQPYPLNELPWGPTQSFYNYRMRLLNQSGPVVTTWGGKRRLILESSEAMLITYQVLDAEGMEMDAKNLLIREDNGNKITFIISPPRLGMFKLMIFGMPKPKQKGKWRLPLLATFLIECKMAKIAKQPPEEEDPPPVVVDYVEPSMEYNELYRQKFSNRSSVIR